MTPPRGSLALAILCGLSVALGALAAQQGTFRTRTDVVTVPVSVTRGRVPVTGLTAADFELTDNGVRQEIDAVSLEHIPIDVTLVVTEFSVFRPGEHRDTLAGAEIARQRLTPSDRLTVVLVDHQVRAVPILDARDLTTHPDLHELRWGTPTAAGYRTGGDMGTRTNQEYGFGIALIDGLYYALARPVDPDRRHLVVAFTDGHDTASLLEIDRFPALASRSDAVMHAVLWATPGDGSSSGWGYVAPGASRGSPRWRESFQALDAAVRRTGGTLQRLERVSDALAQTIETFRSSYVLRFTQKTTPAPGWHQLRVRLTRPGSFTIGARQGYEY